MFRKHSMQVKFVKDQTANDIAAELAIDPEQIQQIVRKSVKSISIGAIAVAGSLIAMRTASILAINYAPKN